MKKKSKAKEKVITNAKVKAKVKNRVVKKATPGKTRGKLKSTLLPRTVADIMTAAKGRQLRGEPLKYQRMLLALRDHLLDGINTTAGNTLNRSQRDSSGDISGYPTHQADAGAEDFDREFALSLVSSEQEGLYEIEEALKRLEDKTFGSCEMCEKQIPKPRLNAVPFARFCLVCQEAVEKEKKSSGRPALSMEEAADDEAAEETAEE